MKPPFDSVNSQGGWEYYVNKVLCSVSRLSMVGAQAVIVAVIIILLISPPNDPRCAVDTEGRRHRWVAWILNPAPSRSKDCLQTLTRQLLCN